MAKTNKIRLSITYIVWLLLGYAGFHRFIMMIYHFKHRKIGCFFFSLIYGAIFLFLTTVAILPFLFLASEPIFNIDVALPGTVGIPNITFMYFSAITMPLIAIALLLWLIDAYRIYKTYRTQ